MEGYMSDIRIDKLEAAREGLEEVRAKVEDFKSLLENLQDLTETSNQFTSLADLTGEAVADEFDNAIYEMEQIFESFEKAINNYDEEEAEALVEALDKE